MTHTPGPWTVGKTGAAVYGPDNNRLAALDARAETLGQRLPNAMLIATSPEMLDFIQRWRDEVLGGDHPEEVQGWAREFILEAGDLLRKVKGGA